MMITTFKGRKGIWTKRNKADFGEFLKVSPPDKFQINYGLFVKATDCSVVIRFTDLFPIKDGLVDEPYAVNAAPFVPVFNILPSKKDGGFEISSKNLYLGLSVNYWAGPSRDLKLAVKNLQDFIGKLGELPGKKLCDILQGIEIAYAP